jgi:hypothetical protein
MPNVRNGPFQSIAARRGWDPWNDRIPNRTIPICRCNIMTKNVLELETPAYIPLVKIEIADLKNESYQESCLTFGISILEADHISREAEHQVPSSPQ